MPEEGFEPTTFRLRDGCSQSAWTAADGSSLLTLDGPSVQTDPDGSRRIVWMINQMIKCLRPVDDQSSSAPEGGHSGHGQPQHEHGDPGQGQTQHEQAIAVTSLSCLWWQGPA